MDINKIIRKILSEEVKPPCSIQILPDDKTFDECGDELSINDLFCTLVEGFTEAMKYLYGDANGIVNLSNLSHTNFEKVNEYFNSIGFNINYEIQPEITQEYTNYLLSQNSNELPNLDENNISNEINLDKLCNHYLNLRSNNLKYKLSFDFYMSK